MGRGGTKEPQNRTRAAAIQQRRLNVFQILYGNIFSRRTFEQFKALCGDHIFVTAVSRVSS